MGRVQAMGLVALAFFLLVITVGVAHGRPLSRNLGHSLDSPLDLMEKDPAVTHMPRPPPTKAAQRSVVGHSVAPSLRSPKKATAREAPHGHSLDHHLGSMERAPVPVSRPNPVTYIPGPPPTKAGQSAVVGRRVAPSLRSPKASTRPPAAPNGHSLDPQLGSMERGSVPASGPNPGTQIPGLPPTKAGQSAVVGHRVAPSLQSLRSPKKASAGPPAAPNGDPIASSTTYP